MKRPLTIFSIMEMTVMMSKNPLKSDPEGKVHVGVRKNEFHETDILLVHQTGVIVIIETVTNPDVILVLWNIPGGAPEEIVLN